LATHVMASWGGWEEPRGHVTGVKSVLRQIQGGSEGRLPGQSGLSVAVASLVGGAGEPLGRGAAPFVDEVVQAETADIATMMTEISRVRISRFLWDGGCTPNK